MNNPQTEIDVANIEAGIMSNGMLDMLAEDVQKQFPEERVNQILVNTLYHAAKSCQATLLVCTLNDLGSKKLQNFLINVNFDEVDGQSHTPLTMAAMSGNIAFVNTLLSHYDVDLERECNVMFDGLLVYGATALWVAAGMGNLQIVKMLVKRGADVNHNTKAQSSPLRAACYEGRLDIVRYLIEHGAEVNATNAFNNTCIMIAAYKGHTLVVDTLLKNGATTNEQALCGATALHYAAESGHQEVVRLLLDHGASLHKNELGVSPALQAAERLHESVVDIFLERTGLMTREEIIDVLELLGATYANDKFQYDVTKAFNNLMRAMEMRFEDPAQIIRKRVIAPVPAYDDWFETENIQELQAIRLNHHSIHMEALTIRERILGKRNPELSQAIIYRGAVMADQGRFDQCQTLWNYAIDLRMINNVSVERDLLRFAQLFSQILRVEEHQLELGNVLTVLVKCHHEIENNKYKIKNPMPNSCPRMLVDHNEQNVVTALYLIKIITRINSLRVTSRPPTNEINNLYEVIWKLIKCDTRIGDGQTILHLAVNGVTPVDELYTNEICKFPCYRTANLLVQVGASVAAVDHMRNTPLHTLVTKLNTRDAGLQTQAERIVKLFVEAGAHLDAVNDQGLTPAKACSMASLSSILVGYQNAHATLKCIAARSIAFHKLKYKGLIPTVLEPFIQMHSADKHCA